MGQCPRCGTNVEPDQKVCYNCGTDLKAAGSAAGASIAGASSAGSSVDGAAGQAGGPGGAATGGSSGAGVSMGASSGAAAATASRGGRGGARQRGRPVGAAGIFAFAVAVLLTLVLQYMLGTVVSPDAYVYRLFRPAGGWVMSVVPGLIVFSLFWTLADLAAKLWNGRVNEHDLERPEIRQIPRLVGQEDMNTTLARLRNADRSLLSRPVGRRVIWLLHHLETTDAQRAHETLRHQSDLDADTAAASYRLVKLFIWAMPILGFIGTVLGISLAVGGFSEFLTTSVSIDEIDRVTAELGEVASGLSFAFDTTLLGLLGGLIATVASSGVQAREEAMLTHLDELGLMIMASAKPGGAGAVARTRGESGDEFSEMMQLRIEDLTHQMDRFSAAVRTSFDGFLDEWSKLPPEVEKVASDLTGLRQHLSAAARSTDHLLSETKSLLEGLRETSSRMTSGLANSIGSVQDTVDDLGGNLERVTSTLEKSMVGMEDANRRLAATLASLGPVLTQLAGPMEIRHMPAQGRGQVGGSGAAGGPPSTETEGV